MSTPETDIALIKQLGVLLRHPLQEVSEMQMKRHGQMRYTWGNAAQAHINPAHINRDGYCLSPDGNVSGLLIQPVTSELLADFPVQEFKNLKYLYLSQVNLRSYSFLSGLTGLASLDLSYNNIKDYSFLDNLTGLTSLDLSSHPINSNRITDYSFLNNLTGLTSLALSSNSIESISFLSNLNNLTSLDLSFNNITNHSLLSNLTGLTSLALRSNGIRNCSFLSSLTKLTSISLSFNDIQDISCLRNLTNLISLELSSNSITNCSYLSSLKQLTSLTLNKTSITDFSFLRELTSLTSLTLSSNGITECSFLSNLKQLTSLAVEGNNITDFSFLRDLTSLTSLDISSNNRTSDSVSDFSFLSNLTELRVLYLRDNEISDCSFLRNLTSLTALYLDKNRISDCSFLESLKNLTILVISQNHIADLSPVKYLKRLTWLTLSKNSIVDCSPLNALADLTSLYLDENKIIDCSFIISLTRLTSLAISNNFIKSVPKYLAEGRMKIVCETSFLFSCIDIVNNPIENPPLEIVNQGNAAILNYYAQLTDQGIDHLYEAKMLIVGEGEAGKTTLAQKVFAPNCLLPHVDDRTRGISIKTHTFPCPDKETSKSVSHNKQDRDFSLNIWDFGGQEIYHYTHRFFLSKRSLYVLVADNRKDDTDFNYWLNIIEHFAGNSPLIIVLNEKGDIQRTCNRAELRSRYADTIKDILPVNFKTQEEPDNTKAQARLKGINTLIRSIEYHAQHLPHIGEPVPARWVDVRQAIEAAQKDGRNYIYREQFDELCNREGITATEDINTLLGYFHDLGILLHFSTNPLLRNRVILNPTWATNAVYSIFDADTIKAKAGRFTRQDCADIWKEPQYRHMHDVLIELMKSFQLVYEIETQTGHPSGNLVAPQLLPQNTPTYDWNPTQNSHMQFRYDAFMPKGIFWQLAVTLYRYISNQNWIWRNGAILQRGNTHAEIIEDIHQRTISLRFQGHSIPAFRAVIVDALDNISQSYHQLKYDKMIPCQCSECTSSNEPEFFKYAVVKDRQEKWQQGTGKKDTIECQTSQEDVSLSLLLQGYEIQTILNAIPNKKDGDDPTPPKNLQPEEAQPTLTTYKIFLASSSELTEDRQEFESFIRRQNDRLVEKGVRLQPIMWETFFTAMSKTRSQDEYNKAIKSCDIFVLLAHTKVGPYTHEEFLTAVETFKSSDKPQIFTYFKDAPPKNMSSISLEDLTTLRNFQQKLSGRGHFYQHYTDSNDLKHQFGEQLPEIVSQ